jgi:DNA-binding transcriptional MerR regulator
MRKPPSKKPQTASLKMKDIVKATGLPKSTILHYVAEGLLPEPVRKGRNVAFYKPECIERVRMIRLLQKYKRLSLAEIKGFIRKAEYPRELAALLQLEQTVFGSDARGAHYTRGEFLAVCGLDEKTLSEILSASLLIPREVDVFDDEDVAAALMLARSISWGFGVKDFNYYARCARELVENDLALRARITKGLDSAGDAVRTEEMTRNARLFRTYLFDRMFMRTVASMRWRTNGR